MIEMTNAATSFLLPSEFDAFLFEPIGEESNGMLLSVLSALARLDVDPWQEASNLALLPAEIATKRLASLIAILPHGLSASLDPGTISARLIKLLPGRTGCNIAARETTHGVGAMIKSRAFIYVLFFLMAAIAGAQFIVASHQPPSQADNHKVPTSSAAFPQTPLSYQGQ